MPSKTINTSNRIRIIARISSIVPLADQIDSTIFISDTVICFNPMNEGIAIFSFLL